MEIDEQLVKEFESSELLYMTKEIRRQAINNLPESKFSIMTEQPIQTQGTDFITKGTVSKFRKNYIFTVEIYDTKNGKLVLSSDPVENEKVEELLIGFREIAPAFFKKLEDKLIGFHKTAPAEQVPAAPQPTPVIKNREEVSVANITESNSVPLPGAKEEEEDGSGIVVVAGVMIGFIVAFVAVFLVVVN
jgi:hypothetical protein